MAFVFGECEGQGCVLSTPGLYPGQRENPEDSVEERPRLGKKEDLLSRIDLAGCWGCSLPSPEPLPTPGSRPWRSGSLACSLAARSSQAGLEPAALTGPTGCKPR